MAIHFQKIDTNCGYVQINTIFTLAAFQLFKYAQNMGESVIF